MDHLRLNRRSLLCEDICVPRGTPPVEVVEDSLGLTRRPLKTLSELASIAEPHKADRITNRLRTMVDKFAARRFNRAGYNRRERANYHKRIPQSQDGRRRRPGDDSGEKRKAPDKRLGMRMRSR